MNKKIYLLLTVLLAWSFNLKAQTAQIESLTADPGTLVSFDITVGDLPANVGAVSLFIGYDPNVLTFTGSTLIDPDFGGYFINNMIATEQVGIQWTNTSGAELDGAILSLEFQYSDLGGTCDLTFDAGCEFADILLNSIVVAYTNGNIGPNAGTATITIDELQAVTGPVSVGVTGAGFTQDAGAVNLNIAFDASVLQFTGYSSTFLLPGLGVNYDNASGMVYVAYSNTTGEPINTEFLTLNFAYDGTGPSELVFTGDCEVAYTDLTLPVVSYDNGLIEPGSSDFTLTIGTIIDATPGNEILIPINAAGFDPNEAGAITLNIGYNAAHLTFLNLVENGSITGVSANVIQPGLLGITWTDMDGALIDGLLISLNFDYNYGSSAITFEGGCEVADMNLDPFAVSYFDGGIAPLVGGPEISLPVKAGIIGQPVTFPISAKNFGLLETGAVSMFIGYNEGVLTYTGNTPGVLSGYFINSMPGSQIGIQWSDMAGIMFADDDILLTLNFTYIGGECDLTFNAGCEFAQPDLTEIPVAFFDGSVIMGSFFDIQAFMEGPYNGLTMNTFLNDIDLIPLSQPFTSLPWAYAGTETVAEIPANAVDWVLLEVRETTGDVETATAATIVAQQAAFILDNGSVVALDGESNVLIPLAFTDNVYVVLWHRNHIRLMSSTALTQVSGVYTYDFTDAQSKTYGSFQKEIGAGVFGMYASDIDSDGEVFSGDLGLLLNEYPSFNVYSNSDVDLDGEVFSGDLNVLLLNYPIFTYIP
jgi:hypothetical protein